MPSDRSFESNIALPPVSLASAYNVSWEPSALASIVPACWPLNIDSPPDEAFVASPSGALATRPRASTGKIETLARSAAGGAKLRLIVDAVQSEPAGKV